MDKKTFILENTSPLACLNIPSIKLYQADEVHKLWHMTEAEMGKIDLPPPYWAFPWAGGEALALYILENPEIVKGKKVLDFASGSGLVGIAAKQAGALSVLSNDIDAFACEAIQLNACLNNVSVTIENDNLVNKGEALQNAFDVILAGDVFYDKIMSETVIKWFQCFDRSRTAIFVGDPVRAYLPEKLLERKATFNLRVSKAIEDKSSKDVTIWQVKI
ncbi:class I SAM-dependent methyltransferase [Bartonella apis]|uniref:class I SAM-dependent methyltransferase n=1 Tax=Bartonella apis TaxID=1686310 RepID=UPI00242AB8B1|nr:50S ribosomal protein L11 methyltransferase [Bartonella apis]